MSDRENEKQRRRIAREEVESTDKSPPFTFADAKALEFQLIDLLSDPDTDEKVKPPIRSLIQYLTARQTQNYWSERWSW